jgi:hypothetical protein
MTGMDAPAYFGPCMLCIAQLPPVRFLLRFKEMVRGAGPTSSFAQQLKTTYPISVKRMDKAWDERAWKRGAG